MIILSHFGRHGHSNVRRIYRAEKESEARSFANLFCGTVYQAYPDEWLVII